MNLKRTLLFSLPLALFSMYRPVSAQDVVDGKALFAQCMACHAADANNGVGPGLKGLVGRKAGTAAGFRFSRAMKTSNVTWNEQTLNAYLADPQKVVPGNVMPFSGMPDAAQRANLVAYLATLK